jgi:hypothetical protein
MGKGGKEALDKCFYKVYNCLDRYFRVMRMVYTCHSYLMLCSCIDNSRWKVILMHTAYYDKMSRE